LTTCFSTRKAGGFLFRTHTSSTRSKDNKQKGPPVKLVTSYFSEKLNLSKNPHYRSNICLQI
ncbi:MAG: hypothetical protein ABF741_10140, partial [Liquorilactobacillus ghanensis]|uniref:hypothetical protein n=1 Tax=Liquorilactobacillus ghanensis TaxID=399370 RepID=UPI0039EB6E0C